MANDTSKKSYYIQDAELNNADQDFFRHEDVSKNLEQIITGNEPPFNVAVIGKWGLGKSSLINLATKDLTADDTKYKRVDINAWKYEKETLSKVFLREVLQALESDDPNHIETSQEKSGSTFLRQFLSIFKHHNNQEGFFKGLWKSIWDNKLLCIGWIVASFTAYFLYKWGILTLDGRWSSMSPANIWKTVWTGYLRNSVTLLAVPFFLAILTKLLQEIKGKSPERIGYLPPDLNVEDYEILLRRKVNGHKNLTILVVVDDLDRLSAKKMVEALDAIKMFMGFKQIIFIVPFDDTILRKSIVQERLNGRTKEDLSGSDELLDKLFQYKLYLPPVLSYDIKSFAENLCKNNLQNFFRDYCENNSESFLYCVRRILIYRNVTTPRQVKKLINTYVSYVMLSRERENAGKVRTGFTNEGMEIIAKIAVLQADFNDVYDLMFEEEDVLKRILDTYGEWTSAKRDAVLDNEAVSEVDNANDEDEENHTEELSEVRTNAEGLNAILERLSSRERHAAKISTGSNPFNQAMPLINFLQHTKSIDSEDILSYLYVAEDKITIATGTKNRRDFIDAAVSRNVEETKILLNKNASLAEAAHVFIQETNDSKDVAALVSSLTHCLDELSQDYQKGIADDIATTAENLANDCDDSDIQEFDFNGLLELYGKTNRPNQFDALLLFVLDKSEDGNRAEEVAEAFYSHYTILSDDIKTELSKYFLISITKKDISIDDALSIRVKYISFDDPHTVKWIKKYYKYLISSIEETEDEEKQDWYITELVAVFNILPKDEFQENFEALQPIYGLPVMSKTLIELLEKSDYKLEQDVIDQVVLAQIEDSEEENGANPFLKKFKYSVNEKNRTTIDTYLEKQVKNVDLVVMLRNMIKSGTDAFKNIPKTIDKVIDGAANTGDANQVITVCELIKSNDNFVSGRAYSILKPYTAYNRSSYNGLADILATLYSINAQPVYDILKANKDTINNYYNSAVISDNFIEFNSDLIYQTIAVNYKANSTINNEERTIVNNYFDALMKVFDGDRLRNEIIHSFALLNPLITDVEIKTYEPKFHSAIKNDNVADVFEIYSAHYDILHDSSSVRKNFVDVILKLLPVSSEKNSVLKTAGSWFTWIRDTPELAKIIFESNDIRDEIALPLLNKFLVNGINDQEDGPELCSLTVRNTSPEFMNKIFRGRTQELKEVLDDILKNPGNYSLDQIVAVIDWMNICYSDNSVASYSGDVYTVAIENSKDDKDRQAIIDTFVKVPRKVVDSDKDKWINIYTTLFRHTESDEMRRKILSFAADNKIRTQVIRSLPNPVATEAKRLLKETKD